MAMMIRYNNICADCGKIKSVITNHVCYDGMVNCYASNYFGDYVVKSKSKAKLATKKDLSNLKKDIIKQDRKEDAKMYAKKSPKKK